MYGEGCGESSGCLSLRLRVLVKQTYRLQQGSQWRRINAPRRSLSIDARQSCGFCCLSAMKGYCQRGDAREDSDLSTAFVLAKMADRTGIMDPLRSCHLIHKAEVRRVLRDLQTNQKLHSCLRLLGFCKHLLLVFSVFVVVCFHAQMTKHGFKMVTLWILYFCFVFFLLSVWLFS